MASDDLTRIRLDPVERNARSRAWRILLPAAAVAGAVVTLAVLALAGGWMKREAAAELANDSAATAPVASAAASRRSESVVAGGYVEARRSAIVYPGRDGVVAEVHVRPGGRVKRGDMLLELVADTAEAEVDMAEADVSLMKARLLREKVGPRAEEIEQAAAEADAATAAWEDAQYELERLSNLESQGASSTQELQRVHYDEKIKRARMDALRARERLLRSGARNEDILAAEAEVARAAASARRARAQFELSRLRAPFDCTVVRIDLEPGEVVSMMNTQAGQPGIEIADVSELWVRIDVPEDRISRVRLGAEAEVVVDALGGQRLQAEVVEIAPVADRRSNTIEVAVRVTDPPQLLCPNMSARVAITVGGENP